MPNPTILEQVRRRLQLWARIAAVTLREPLLRLAGHAGLLLVIGLGVWFARMGWDSLPLDDAEPAFSAAAAASAPLEESPAPRPELPAFAPVSLPAPGVVRQARMHTVFPERPRLEVIQYQVQQGDTLFGIAEKFGLKPESVLWANFEVLQDDPHPPW